MCSSVHKSRLLALDRGVTLEWTLLVIAMKSSASMKEKNIDVLFPIARHARTFDHGKRSLTPVNNEKYLPFKLDVCIRDVYRP